MGGLAAAGSEVCLRVLPAPGSPQSRQSVDALAGQRSCSSRLQGGRLCSSTKSLEKAVKGEQLSLTMTMGMSVPVGSLLLVFVATVNAGVGDRRSHRVRYHFLLTTEPKLLC